MTLLLALSACNKPAPRQTSVNRADEEKALRETDMSWADAASKKNLESVTSFYTVDATQLPPNAPVVVGPDALKKGWTDIFAMKDLALKWQPTMVQVADSGEIGYTSGTFTMEFTDPNGVKVSDKGKYLEVWKKVDGKWKCHYDMFSSDLPIRSNKPDQVESPKN